MNHFIILLNTFARINSNCYNNFDMTLNIKQQLNEVPAKSGVYMFKDNTNTVIYVGKATNLKQRTRSYFGISSGLSVKTRLLSGKICEIEYIVTDSEQEALILECSLIKKFRPKYNVRLKDDKSFPYLKVTINDDWPRIFITRNINDSNARYFGPFASALSVKRTLKFIKHIFPFRTCSTKIDGTARRPCLRFHIHQCAGPCIGAISKDDYHFLINQVVQFLEGKREIVLNDLYNKLTVATENMEFEKAALIRDQIKAIEEVIERQKSVVELKGEHDVIAISKNRELAYVEIFFVRNNKVTGHDHFIMEGVYDETHNEVITAFIKQYYQYASYIPSSILLQYPTTEYSFLSNWLKELKGQSVAMRVPKKGAKKHLLNIVSLNADNGLKIEADKSPDTIQTFAGLQELRDKLKLHDIPMRIECYDISNIQGMHSVGSMVVLQNGIPQPSDYRRFKIKTITGPDDYSMMQEVLYRRLNKLTELIQNRNTLLKDSNVSNQPNSKDSSIKHSEWNNIPDLILIDGGKGHLKAASKTLNHMDISIPLAGIAKENEDVYITSKDSPIIFEERSPALHILQTARDEAHRFAISYHRKIRRYNNIQSALDGIPGIGPKRKRALIKKFGSLTALRKASIEEISQVDLMSLKTAKQIKEYW
jgi:excinuclease ABC subunit C